MQVNGWTAPLLLLLAACTPAAEEPANEAEAPAGQEEAAPVPSLAGDWRVTAINGAAPSQSQAIDAGFTADRLTLRSNCVVMAFDYSQDRNIVTFGPASRSGCPGTLTHDESLIEQAIAQANIAMFAQNGNEVQLTGPGGSATLARR